MSGRSSYLSVLAVSVEAHVLPRMATDYAASFLRMHYIKRRLQLVASKHMDDDADAGQHKACV